MTISLQNKIALITGATKGIGEAIAYALGKAGATVIVSSRKKESVDMVTHHFRKEGINAIGIAANNGNMEDIEALVNQIKHNFDGIDILVNNVGTNPISAPIHEIELRTYDKIMDVNLKGTFYLSQLVYPLLKNRGGGSIINIASIEGITPSPLLSVYSMSKAAMIMMTKSMAKEWGTDRIRVNAICPGYIKTRLTEAVWSNENYLQKILNHQIIPNLGSPQDIAGIALLLASEEGAYFTGSIVTVDGGFTV